MLGFYDLLLKCAMTSGNNTMPMHDWTTVESGTYHSFHQAWAVMIMGTLNRGLMPAGYTALLDREVQGPIPDVLTVRQEDVAFPLGDDSSVATVTRTERRVIMTAEPETALYARRANRVAVRNSKRKRKLVAVIELVSPGSKRGRKAMKKFVEKTVSFLIHQINVLIIDPFPPGPSNPQGVHPLVWEDFDDAPYVLPNAKPLAFVAYQTSPQLRAHLEPIEVCDPLPDMPLFLCGDVHVNIPLEKTYMDTCTLIPEDSRADFQ